MLYGDRFSEQAVKWWRECYAKDRGAVARLRRGDLYDIRMEQWTQTLLRYCGGKEGNDWLKVAVVAGALAHVRPSEKSDGVHPLASLVGPDKIGSDESGAVVKTLRFRRLLAAKTPEETLRAFRRLISLVQPKYDSERFSVGHLAQSILDWPEWSGYSTDITEKRRQEWIYHYWNRKN